MQKNMTRFLVAVLTLCLLLGNLAPMAAYATEDSQTDNTQQVQEPTETTVPAETTAPEDTTAAPEQEPVAVISDELKTEDYATFLAELKQLETLAASYAAIANKDAGELMLNFLRTGVERYNDGNWKTLAGEEIVGFTNYVAQQDAANGTTVMRLRNLELFTIPNGQTVDFGHMFGTMNIAYIASQASADLGGWAGDICDLLYYSKNFGNVPAGTVDEMAAYIKTNCFGVNADDAFGMDDFYGDLDAIYLIAQMKAGKSLSAVAEAYFTANLTDADRAEFFLKNRFQNLYTPESVREAVLNAYTSNVGLSVLEAGRDLSGETDLRIACCYAFADYVYALAGHTLEEPKDPEPSDPEPSDPEPSDPEPSDPEPSEPSQPDGTNPYYSVFSSNTSVLAPGISQTIRYATTADGKQIVYYVATVDVTRDDVTIMANYHDADPSKGWAMQRVTDQVAALTAKHTNPEDPDNHIENFRAVVSTNGDGFNMSTGKPGGLLIMGGQEWHGVDKDGFFAILKDGTAKIGTQADYAVYKDQIQEAIGGFGAVLIKNGEIVVTQTTNYYNSRASRTAIGITAAGEVIMMVLDGRQEPFSAGGSYIEIAQIMLDAGCVEAINLDGGGSTTFAAKPEGSDEVVVVNRPSDGFQRSVAASLVAISTAPTSKEFSYANIASDYDYLTVGTSVQLTVNGVSASGSAADVPEGVLWQLSDSTIGTLADGVFTAAKLGDVELQLVLDGKVVGTKTLHVVVPDALSFTEMSVNVIYNTMCELPLVASYNGNPVAYNMQDLYVGLQYSNAGKTQGTSIYVYEASGYRSLYAGAMLLSNPNVNAIIVVNCYRADEAMFDFDNATSGDAKFAWTREVSNSDLQGNGSFQIVDMSKPQEIGYVFALDMKAIDIPEKLKDLTSMLPGGDNQGTSAWDYLLRLAERVSTLTTVTITVQFDANLQLDISGLTVSNDFFKYESATLDEETNTVVIMACWIDRTAAVDPLTANSVCILSGIKAVAKSGGEEILNVVNSGHVDYKVYLRASSLYSFANQPANQQTYDLYPFSRTLPDGKTESGAYYEASYASFNDSFTLSRTKRQGWYNTDSALYYYKNNVALTGIQLLPSYEDSTKYLAYRFDDHGACVGTVTGFYEINGDRFYAVAGVRKAGWQAIIGNDNQMHYYYFQYGSGKALTGKQTIDGYNYEFEDYKLVRGQLVTDSKGVRYRWAGNWAFHEWLNIDGKISYAQANGYLVTGIKWMYSPEAVWSYYAMDENGVWMQDFSGIYEWNGGTYLVKDGFAIDYPGLFEMDGYYYYISSTNVMVKDRNYWISKTNGLMPEASYHFDAEGRMTNPYIPPVEDPDEPAPEVKNGIVAENGSLYYYVDGKLNYAGLIKIGDYFYYVRGTGELVHGRSYWITKNNGLMASATFEFDEEGRMIIEQQPDTPDTPVVPPTPPVVKDGIVAENGGLYYYVDGKLNYAGLIEIEGELYYVRGTGQLVTSANYWPTKTNGLLTTTRQYWFDEQGRMEKLNVPSEPDTPDTPDTPVEPEVPVVKNGIVAENGSLYYYVDGKLNYAGLIKIDGYFYYVRGTGELVHDCDYWPTKTNGWFTTTQRYTFDSQGRMVNPPV